MAFNYASWLLIINEKLTCYLIFFPSSVLDSHVSSYLLINESSFIFVIFSSYASIHVTYHSLAGEIREYNREQRRMIIWVKKKFSVCNITPMTANENFELMLIAYCEQIHGWTNWIVLECTICTHIERHTEQRFCSDSSLSLVLVRHLARYYHIWINWSIIYCISISPVVAVSSRFRQRVPCALFYTHLINGADFYRI
jgi:hypothetical protein